MNSNALKTDLYELTMAAGYFQNRFNPRATFELYCHTLPKSRAYLVACGLAQVIEYILHLQFSTEEVRFLKSLPVFKGVETKFFDYLRHFKFSGDVWAMEEGEICFANEPILQIEAPIIEAQILETYLLSVMNIETLVATKAARVVGAAGSDGVRRSVVDFGSRRAHGPQAGVLAARAAYVGGCAGTSNVFAGKEFGIPIFGTMAHSWVQALTPEENAFAKYYAVFPRSTTLLIDTYDTLSGAKKAAALGRDIKGVRLDSGDILQLSRRVRKILDKEGLKRVKIVASGNLNEYKIRDLIDGGAPIDVFGVGTDMVVARDAPALDLTYKLVQIQDKHGKIKYTAKRSQGKHSVPGRKQVFRRFNAKGRMAQDIISLTQEQPPKGSQSLLKPVITDGKLRMSLPLLDQTRQKVQRTLGVLPPGCLRILASARWNYRVEYSPAIRRLQRQFEKNH